MFNLILIARRKERLDALKKELQEKFSVTVEILITDLSKLIENEKIVSKILSLDNLDVLINNAGFGINNAFLKIDLIRHIDMINVHYTSPVMFCHAAIPGMIKRNRGVIINTSSTAAINKAQGSVMYTSTKTALTVFSELLQEKIKDTSVIIQSLCPGYTYSEFHDTELMSGFQRSWFPKEAWMTAEEVVSLSLKALKKREVIFIPGELNRTNVKRNREASLEQYLIGKRL